MNVLEGFIIRVKIMEIKSVEINAVAEINAQHN